MSFRVALFFRPDTIVVVNQEEQKPVRVLLVDDSDLDLLPIVRSLRSTGYLVETAGDGREALEKVEGFRPEVIVTDLIMPRMDGFELLRSLREIPSAPPAITLTGFGTLEKAVATVKDLGAYWFVEKPISADALQVLIDRAALQGRLSNENYALRHELAQKGVLVGLVGQSRPMQELFALIRQVAPTRAPVLITGESGTGKEMVSRAIHALSERRDGPFVPVNCAALPETLIESELFGHERGAFTGAQERRIGCIERADRGTLLLDELGEMPIHTQAKLLRVLEDSRVRRLGGKTETAVNVRILAATNRDPQAALQQGQLREDLFYRLNVFHLHIPPLRNHKEDLSVLTEAMIEGLNEKHDCRVSGVEPEVMEAFQQYNWPGNVRELRNVLERAVILAGDKLIAPHHLPAPFRKKPTPAPAPEEPSVLRLPVGTSIPEAEEALIRITLNHTKNNKTRAADILGISVRTLHMKLKEYSERDQSGEQALETV
ncbi:MAG: sigma-54-dependent Fis family transcriptional regulator [Bryobacterales bacterium]|nr:sigma-54-dependent Fis family transcriptional regulator [Bryobacterales bacterium]